MTPTCELRTEIARLANALARAEAQLAAAPQAVQPAVPVNLDFAPLREMLGSLNRAWGEAMNIGYCPGSAPHQEAMKRVRSMQAGAARYLDALESFTAPAHPAEGVPAQAVGEMTAERASYFMRRFLKEEKLLGPNEQAALHYVISLLAATQPAAQGRTTGYIVPKGRYVPPVLFNPYSGEPRDARDIASDPNGILIVPPGAALAAQAKQGGA